MCTLDACIKKKVRRKFFEPEGICFHLSIRLAVVSVVSFVVHDQLVVDKVEAVGARLERILYHEGDGLLVEAGKLVDVLAAVLAVGDAEAKVKVEGFQMLVPKEVTLNHAKILREINLIN